MKKKIFGVLQRIGRSFMLPIAVPKIPSKPREAIVASLVRELPIH